MASVFLIIVAVVMAVLILGSVLMMMIYFSNPDDSEEHYLPKVIVVQSDFVSAPLAVCIPSPSLTLALLCSSAIQLCGAHFFFLGICMLLFFFCCISRSLAANIILDCYSIRPVSSPGRRQRCCQWWVGHGNSLAGAACFSCSLTDFDFPFFGSW